MIQLVRTTNSAVLKSHFLSLFELAMIDDDLAQAEREYLYDIGARHDISKEQMHQILFHEPHTPFTMPESKEERIGQVFDLVCMMLADNKLDEREVELCIKLARKLGFAENILSGLVKALITAADDDADHETVRAELEIYIHYSESI